MSADLAAKLAFVPYTNTVIEKGERISTDQPADQIGIQMEKANVLAQQVLLQDLLIKGVTSNENKYVHLATALFIKAPDATREDFLFSLLGGPQEVFKKFRTSVIAASIFHGLFSDGLTAEQLQREQGYAEAFKKFK